MNILEETIKRAMKYETLKDQAIQLAEQFGIQDVLVNDEPQAEQEFQEDGNTEDPDIQTDPPASGS